MLRFKGYNGISAIFLVAFLVVLGLPAAAEVLFTEDFEDNENLLTRWFIQPDPMPAESVLNPTGTLTDPPKGGEEFGEASPEVWIRTLDCNGDHALAVENYEFESGILTYGLGIRSMVGFNRGATNDGDLSTDLRVTFDFFGQNPQQGNSEAFPSGAGPFGPWHLDNDPSLGLELTIDEGLDGWGGWFYSFEENGSSDGYGRIATDPGDRLVDLNGPAPGKCRVGSTGQPAGSNCILADLNVGAATDPCMAKQTAVKMRCWAGDLPEGGGMLEYSIDGGVTWKTFQASRGVDIDTRVSPDDDGAGSVAVPGTADPLYLGLGVFKAAIFDNIIVEFGESTGGDPTPTPVPGQASGILSDNWKNY